MRQSSADAGERQSTQAAEPARTGRRGPQAERLCKEHGERPQSLGDARTDGLSRQGVVPPYALGAADQNCIAARAHGLPAQSGDRTLQTSDGDRLLGFFRRRLDAGTMERMDQRPLAHRERQSLCARRRLRRRRLAHPQKTRHRRAHTLIRLQSAARRRLPKHQKRQMAQRYRSQRSPKNASDLLRTKQPCGFLPVFMRLAAGKKTGYFLRFRLSRRSFNR